MNGWPFTKGRDGWHWHLVGPAGNLLKTSSRPLRSLMECIRDAMKNGYTLDTVRAARR
jgi:hypothetical protein